MAEVGPTVRRRQLASLMRALRIDRGLTLEQVAEQLLCSPSKISRLETGQRGPSARDIRDLCNLYRVTDEHDRKRLMTLAHEAKQPTWWQTRGLPYSTFFGLEADASSIKDFGYGLMPGLLQTEGYARAILGSLFLNLSAEQLEQRVAQRIARQRLLDSDHPPRFHATIDEAVLYRVVGSTATMISQLEHLLVISQHPSVTIQVLPFDIGALPTGPNKFIILGFDDPDISSVVYVESLTGDLYLDREEDLALYTSAFSSLIRVAATPQRTVDMISRKIRAYRSTV